VDCKSCCCAHSHTDKCKWQKFANKFGYEKAHELHSGVCSCELRFNKHSTKCKVYLDFKKFIREYVDQDEEDKKPKKSEWDFDDDFDFDAMVADDTKDDVLCCCKSDIPHDETLKFMLKVDPKYENETIFKNRKNGALVQLYQKNL
jgi:hypothetical protein